MRKSAHPGRGRGEDGQVLIEFIAVLPLLCAILFGIVGFGLAMNYASDLNQIAAMGARKAAVTPTMNVVSDVKAAAEPAIEKDPTMAVTVCLPEGDDPGDPVMVKATVDHKILPVVPIAKSLLTIKLSGRATMRLEREADFAGGFSTSAAPCA